MCHVLMTRVSLIVQIVKEHAPKEPPVYALLGQVCYKMGRNQDALRYFNTAIDLDPKQGSVLKVQPCCAYHQHILAYDLSHALTAHYRPHSRPLLDEWGR
jgi:tetratricopeptide (TPR) repeat protein